MTFKIIPMTAEHANHIFKWTYPPPYELYNIEETPDALSEFLNGSYYAVIDDFNQLIGFYCYGKSAIVPLGSTLGAYEDVSYLDIGIGLKPALCGRGNGHLFFQNAIYYAKQHFNAYKIRLTVASFNQRAIKLYEDFGFKKVLEFNRKDHHQTIEFWVMLYNDFDRIIDRSDQSSIKYDGLKSHFNKSDLISMWIADMDFEVPICVSDAIIQRANDKIYGYTQRSQTYYKSMINWFNRRHNLDLEPDHLLYSPGAVTSINVAVNAFSNPGDKIIIQTPVYHPFHMAVRDNSRIILENQLIKTESGYEMDFDQLELLAKEATLLILCNPHNPIGRVWRPDELQRLNDICIRNDVRIISDEIHCDLVYKPNKHLPMMSISDKPVITLVSATKTFNLAGLQASFIICTDPEDKRKMNHFYEIYDINLNNAFSLVAVEAAFNSGEPWLNAMLEYVHENMILVKTYCEEHMPELRANMPEGTYLQWIDCRNLNLDDEALMHFMIDKAHLAVNSGHIFGSQGSGFIRLNVACPRQVVEKALNHLRLAVESTRVV